MSYKKVNIGVIGAGHIAQVAHLPQWKANKKADLIAVCDIQPGKAEWVAKKYGISHHYTDPAKMLENVEIDAVDICTETTSHYQLVEAAVKAGKHVLVEKPFTKSYDEARKLTKLCDKHKSILMVGMNVRFRKDAIFLKSFLDGGELGDVFWAKLMWLSQRDLSRPNLNWLYKKEHAGGGVLMDLGIQLIDVGWWLLGNKKPVSVKAMQFHLNKDLDVEDTFSGIIQFDNGSLLQFDTSWAIVTEKDSFTAQFYGSAGTAQLNPLKVFKNMHGNPINIVPMSDDNNVQRYKRSFQNELNHFLTCIQQNVPVQSSASEIAERLKIIEALYQSAKEKREVLL